MRLPTNPRTPVTLARAAGITRICFGTAFIIAPHASARPWAGAGADSAGAQLLTRSMGIRDLLLGVGLLQALNQSDHPTAARWLSYGAAAGVIDAGATLAAYPSLPRTGRAFLLFITGALITDTLLAVQLRRPTTRGNNGTASGDSVLKTAGLPPLADRMLFAGRHGRYPGTNATAPGEHHRTTGSPPTTSATSANGTKVAGRAQCRDQQATTGLRADHIR